MIGNKQLTTSNEIATVIVCILRSEEGTIQAPGEPESRDCVTTCGCLDSMELADGFVSSCQILISRT